MTRILLELCSDLESFIKVELWKAASDLPLSSSVHIQRMKWLEKPNWKFLKKLRKKVPGNQVLGWLLANWAFRIAENSQRYDFVVDYSDTQAKKHHLNFLL